MCSTLSFFIFILIAQHSLCNPPVDRDLPIGHQCLSLCKKKTTQVSGPVVKTRLWCFKVKNCFTCGLNYSPGTVRVGWTPLLLVITPE